MFVPGIDVAVNFVDNGDEFLVTLRNRYFLEFLDFLFHSSLNLY